MLPALGDTMFRIMRANVVLPLPDSPMIAKISGRAVGDREADPVHCADVPATAAARRWCNRG